MIRIKILVTTLLCSIIQPSILRMKFKYLITKAKDTVDKVRHFMRRIWYEEDLV